MSFFRNKYVIMGLVAVAGFIAFKWWKKRQAASAPATTGAAAKATGA
jgi:hypothetical protein